MFLPGTDYATTPFAGKAKRYVRYGYCKAICSVPVRPVKPPHGPIRFTVPLQSIVIALCRKEDTSLGMRYFIPDIATA